MRSFWQNLAANGFLDKTGATVSWFCAAHCLILPLVFSFLPLGGLSFLIDEKIEWLIILTAILIGLASLLPSFFHRHGKFCTLLLFGGGVGLIVVSKLFFENSLAWNLVFVLAGAALISAAHLLNYRLCRAAARFAQPS